jgi:hypothetical protein
MYIILGFYTRVNDYAENTLKNLSEFSGAGRETSTGVPKLSQIFFNYLLTTPYNSVILSITLLYPAQARITLAGVSYALRQFLLDPRKFP